MSLFHPQTKQVGHSAAPSWISIQFPSITTKKGLISLADIHLSLPAEPLLAGTAVLNVLEDFRKQGAPQALLFPGLLEAVIGSCACGQESTGYG